MQTFHQYAAQHKFQVLCCAIHFGSDALFLTQQLRHRSNFISSFSLFVILSSKNCHTVTLFPEHYIFTEAQIKWNQNFLITVFIFTLGITVNF
jgi:hypothetical protein